MARYFIYEGNLEKLEKKLGAIERKCAKYNVRFNYEKVGEEYREVKTEDGETITSRFVEIEVEGFMQHENWEFIATIDHTDEGNIVRQYNTTIQVPERYYHTDPVCEHCNTLRRRKFTYLVHNTETDEWKQVGASCLKEFTKGLDADYVAKYESFFDYLHEGESGCYSGVSYERFYSLNDFLCYAKEVVNHYGYANRDDAEFYGKDSTKDLTWNFWNAIECHSRWYKSWAETAQMIGFDAMKEENKQYIEEAIAWIRAQEVNPVENSYMFNLKMACNSDYFPFRNSGFIVSLLPTYYRHLKHLEYVEKQRQVREAEAVSEYQGEVGQRLTVEVVSVELVWSNDSFYGMTYLYKFVDANNNIYMWSTGKSLADVDIKTLTGTVKSHDEYRGVKQTHLTRCKVA